MSASTLRLYRDILRTAQRWPSTRRQKVVEEIRGSARERRLQTRGNVFVQMSNRLYSDHCAVWADLLPA